MLADLFLLPVINRNEYCYSAVSQKKILRALNSEKYVSVKQFLLSLFFVSFLWQKLA